VALALFLWCYVPGRDRFEFFTTTFIVFTFRNTSAVGDSAANDLLNLLKL